MGESWEYCASREVKEETGLTIENIKFNSVTNDIAIGGDESKHYITIFMTADVSDTSPPLQNMEPHKCEGWEWMQISSLYDLHTSNPTLIFDPLRRLISETNYNILGNK
jgi:8-oxo-dGTP diphosphatase